MLIIKKALELTKPDHTFAMGYRSENRTPKACNCYCRD